MTGETAWSAHYANDLCAKLAEPFITRLAGLARTATGKQRRDDPAADPAAPRRVGGADDGANDFVAEDEREIGAVRFTCHDMKICATDTAGAHLDKHLPGSHQGGRPSRSAQAIRPVVRSVRRPSWRYAPSRAVRRPPIFAIPARYRAIPADVAARGAGQPNRSQATPMPRPARAFSAAAISTDPAPSGKWSCSLTQSLSAKWTWETERRKLALSSDAKVGPKATAA